MMTMTMTVVVDVKLYIVPSFIVKIRPSD